MTIKYIFLAGLILVPFLPVIVIIIDEIIDKFVKSNTYLTIKKLFL